MEGLETLSLVTCWWRLKSFTKATPLCRSAGVEKVARSFFVIGGVDSPLWPTWVPHANGPRLPIVPARPDGI